MHPIEVGNALTQLVAPVGIDLEDVVEIVIRPAKMAITTAYINGAGELHNHTTYVPITITLPEEK